MGKMNNTVKIYKGKWIGVFFLLAFIAYGFGRSFFESENIKEQYLGTILIIINSILVLFIGVWLKRTLRQYNELVGNIYFLTRVFEAIDLASIVLNLFPNVNISLDIGYFIAMLVLGIGSISMCFTFLKHRITPKWMAIWGVAGYALMAFGFLMELFGNKWSMYLLGLGALWEITFAIWLVLKGGKEKSITTR